MKFFARQPRSQAIKLSGSDRPGEPRLRQAQRHRPQPFHHAPFSRGARQLAIYLLETFTADVIRGQAFETITAKAMKNATNVSETNLTWKWTTEDPSKG